MKLTDVIGKASPNEKIRRKIWNFYYIPILLKTNKPLYRCDLNGVGRIPYMPSIEDLLADDWEVVQK